MTKDEQVGRDEVEAAVLGSQVVVEDLTFDHVVYRSGGLVRLELRLGPLRRLEELIGDPRQRARADEKNRIRWGLAVSGLQVLGPQAWVCDWFYEQIREIVRASDLATGLLFLPKHESDLTGWSSPMGEIMREVRKLPDSTDHRRPRSAGKTIAPPTVEVGRDGRAVVVRMELHGQHRPHDVVTALRRVWTSEIVPLQKQLPGWRRYKYTHRSDAWMQADVRRAQLKFAKNRTAKEIVSRERQLAGTEDVGEVLAKPEAYLPPPDAAQDRISEEAVSRRLRQLARRTGLSAEGRARRR